jgi:hypothetical protein
VNPPRYGWALLAVAVGAGGIGVCAGAQETRLAQETGHRSALNMCGEVVVELRDLKQDCLASLECRRWYTTWKVKNHEP